MSFDPEHGSDHLSDLDWQRLTQDEDGFTGILEGHVPDQVHAAEDPDQPSCGPGHHVITRIPICFRCGAVFGEEVET